MPPSPAEIAAAAAAAPVNQGTALEPGEQAIEQATEEAAQSEPTITHNNPILASGSAGPIVRELVQLLAVVGHATNTIISGENPGAVLDNSVMGDVKSFMKEHEIVESPNLDISGDFVGPYTWQALYDEAAKLLHL